MLHAGKSEAMKLRMRGYSYNEIQSCLGIPKSTLSGWFRDLVLSDHAQERLAKRRSIGSQILVKRNKMQTHHAQRRAEQIQNKARAEIPSISRDMLRIIGIALYWAEGYKRLQVKNGREITAHVISFVNADPDMIRSFLLFSKEILEIPVTRIRVTMRLYDHINDSAARAFWLEITRLPPTAFRKTTRTVSLSSRGKRPFNRLLFGALQIEIANTAKFHELIGWIEGMKKQLKHATIPERLGSSVGRASA